MHCSRLQHLPRLPYLPPLRLALRWLLVAGLVWLPLLGQAWDEQRQERAARAAGPRAAAAWPALRRLLADGAQWNEAARLAPVNQFFNLRLAFRDDQEIWGQADYWASPMETLEKGAGDCEDFAIAKYFSLLAMGTPVQHLRLVYVRATGVPGTPAGQATPHMVLAYYANPQAEPLILDNLVPEILGASRRTDLSPVFSFNGEGLWRGTQGATAGDPTARLSPWRSVMDKALNEGFL